MRKIGLINLLIGLVIIAFPSLIGKFVVGSAALIIASLSLFSMVVFWIGRKYLGAILSLVFFISAVRMMYHPQLLLQYVGSALVLSSLIQILMMRRKAILISSGITLVLGILAYENSQASLVVTTVIFGILFAGLGGTMMIWDYFVPDGSVYFWTWTDGKTVRRVKRNVRISEAKKEEIEEAEFTEIED